jgi:hypothetical protein
VTQISCYDNARLAPSGCTQYYTGLSGTVQSFNWKTGDANNVQLANQNQKICFRLKNLVSYGKHNVRVSLDLPIPFGLLIFFFSISDENEISAGKHLII